MLSSQRRTQIVGTGLAVGLLWAYWPALTDVAERWWTDPKYSHGYFVPLFAVWLLWRRWRHSEVTLGGTAAPGVWWGLPLLSAGLALHLAGNYFFVDWVSEASLLVSLAGLCVCLGGWPLARLAAPSIGFLAFMLPLPFVVEVGLAHPLQSLATTASTFLLQLCGFTVTATGNYIEMNSGILNVADACSGLGMLVTFFALMTGIAIVLKRPLVDKLVLVASAVPIALIANVIRITVTGILFEKGSRAVAMSVYHDGAGLFMMTLALVLTGIELLIFSHLLVEPPSEAAPRETLGLDLGLSAPAPVPRGGAVRELGRKGS